MFKFIFNTALVIILSVNLLSGQEICNNGVDDDGNGLIDHLDPACDACYGYIYGTIAEDFEDYSCCPEEDGQTFCINGWQATSSSPDYFNTCDYLGGIIKPPAPLPIPSGNGAVGLATWGESIGICLDNHLLAGEPYDISFFVGFHTALELLASLDVEFSLFGSTNCANMVDHANCFSSTWFEIASFNVIGDQDYSWVHFSSTFSPSVDISAIAIGHSCAFIENILPHNYHFIDDIKITGLLGPLDLLGDIPEISYTGNCIDGIYIETDIYDADSYQWYVDGDPILGATTNPYQIESSQLGTYQVSIFDDLGCNIISDSLVVDTEIEVLDIDGDILHLNCFLEPTGSIDISVSDQTNSPLTYFWSNGETTEDIANLYAGTYTVIATDAYGCFGEMEFTIEGPNPMINTIDVVQPYMGNPGSATITTTGGIMPYTYQWSNGNSSSSDDNLSPGIYSVTVSDENGCDEVLVFEITSDFVVHTSTVGVSCHESCDGTISLDINGPDVAYNVVWADANLDGFMPSDVCAGSYDYVVSDESGSTFEGTVTVLEPDELIVSADYQDFVCDISENTIIALEVSGGVHPYIYSWSNGSTMDTLLNAGVGNHTVTVEDDNGCIESLTFVVDTFPSLKLSFATTLAGCNGALDGSIDLDITGGQAPFMFHWNNGSVSEDLSDLTQGIYTVTVTDSNNCMAIDSVVVHADSGIEVSAIVSNTNCSGLDDGSIYLDILGGTNDLEIEWDIASDSNYIFDLPPGSYSVTITNENGCTWNESYSLSQNSDLTITAEIEDNPCFQGQEGSINIQIENSTSPYTILWSNGSTDEDLFNISAGLYELSLIDSFGCEYNYSYVVDEESEMEYSSSLTEPGCNGASDGSIVISPISGSLPLSYNWSTGDITNHISDIQAGSYYLTITDNAGCTKLDSFILSENSTLELNENITHNPCHGDSQGQISIGISGGIEPYEVIWSNNNNTTSISNLTAGTYMASVTDAVGCEIIQLYTVFEPDSLEIIEEIALPLCHDELGSISIEGIGGLAPYFILWSTGATSSTINIEPGNDYEVTLTDINNCRSTLDFTVEEIFEIDITILSITEPGSTNNNGEIEIEIEGGTLPYQIEWSNGQVGTTASGLGFGTHTINVVDANGCTAQLNIDLDNDPLTLQSSLEHNICFGECNGSIELDISGGILPYSLTWSDGQTTPSLTSLCNGMYQATIVDASGSEIISDIFNIESPDQIDIDGQVMDISCVGIPDGAIEINAAGGTMPFEYSWNNGMTDKKINNLSPGIYRVTVTDQNGCINTSDFTLEDIPVVDFELELIDFDCDEEYTSIEVTGDNLNNYPIYINDSEVMLNENGHIGNLSSGIYSISYKINEDCMIAIQDVEVINPNEKQINLSVESAFLQEGELLELTLEIISDLAVEGFEIDWDVSNAYECTEFFHEGQCKTVLITVTEDEVVEVTFTDDRGCIEVLTSEIMVDKTKYVFVPNIFSPNGDGINDEFEITTNYLDITISQFVIYDRWGNNVYSQNNKQLSDLTPWDGISRNKEANDGVYMYVLSFKTIDGIDVWEVGDITIIR